MKALLGVVSVVVLLGGCGFDGGPIITGDIDHKFNMGEGTEDSAPLSVQVKAALRKNAQTTLSRIEVSSSSEDTVRLTGYVDNDAIRQEAERVANGVPGVRFVVNTLNIQK